MSKQSNVHCADEEAARAGCQFASKNTLAENDMAWGGGGMKQQPFSQMFKKRQSVFTVSACVLSLTLSLGSNAQEQAPPQTPAAQQRLTSPNNQSSQRYEVNQTFARSAYLKDNNVWVYDKEFADLFGMPAQYIEDVQGIAAAAFRIEDTSYQECGFGGQADACKKVHQCLIDLYFDESKTPLPWASNIQSQWLPWYASMRWLRPLNPAEKPYGMSSPDTPPDIIRNETLTTPIVAFADPVSKRQAIFTSNRGDAAAGEEEVSGGSMPLIGYTRDFYRKLSVVNLQFGCGTVNRNRLNLRLDAKKSGAYEAPIARFNKLVLPEGFVDRINTLQKSNSDRNAVFYRSLFAPPLGTKGTTELSPTPQ